jgi:lysophospholipase L1-like esterase
MRKSWSRWLVGPVALVTLTGCSTTASAPGPSQSPVRPPASRSTTPVTQPSQPSEPTSQATGQSSQSRGDSPRIMIVGDSITKGSAGDYTWQYWLYEHLKADGITPQMVGPNRFLHNNVTGADNDASYANPNFGRANDTTWGMTLFSQKIAIGSTVSAFRPDYLLVLLGLDDLFWFGLPQPTMAANLATFIASARSAAPHIRLVFGLVPPDIHTKTKPAFAAKVKAYNASIISTAARLSTTSSPIAVARDTDINVAADLWDGTHPNTNGQIRIAAAFADALASKFHLGASYPTPFPVMPIGPLTHPKLTVAQSLIHGQAKLSWTLVPGASGYYVYMKDLTAHQTSYKRLPFPLTYLRDPFTAGLLSSGSAYAFKVQACKGSDCGAFSNVVNIVAP